MAFDLRLVERAVLRRRLSMALRAVVVGVVLIVGAGLIFGWTLTAGTGFDFTITTDPAGALPF
jgi:hypothetical protein